MSLNESASFKRQLLDAKSTIAELQSDNRRLEQKLIDLEALIVSREQTILFLEGAQKTFEASLQGERERVIADFERRLAEEARQRQKLERRSQDLEAELASLVSQKDSYKLGLENFEKRFSGLFAGKEPNVQEMLNSEFKEKQILGEKILELTQQLNESERSRTALEQENRKYRIAFGVPDSFAHSDDLRRNHITKIGFLEKEIEALEEERAELKCKLRQMAAFVSPKSFDGEVFSQLSDSQKEALCLYAVNLLSGKKEANLDDKSKELTKACDRLALENEVLRKDCEEKQRALLEFAQSFNLALSGKLDPKALGLLSQGNFNGQMGPAFNPGSKFSRQNTLNNLERSNRLNSPREDSGALNTQKLLSNRDLHLPSNFSGLNTHGQIPGERTNPNLLGTNILPSSFLNGQNLLSQNAFLPGRKIPSNQELSENSRQMGRIFSRHSQIYFPGFSHANLLPQTNGQNHLRLNQLSNFGNLNDPTRNNLAYKNDGGDQRDVPLDPITIQIPNSSDPHSNFSAFGAPLIHPSAQNNLLHFPQPPYFYLQNQQDKGNYNQDEEKQVPPLTKQTSLGKEIHHAEKLRSALKRQKTEIEGEQKSRQMRDHFRKLKAQLSTENILLQNPKEPLFSERNKIGAEEEKQPIYEQDEQIELTDEIVDKEFKNVSNLVSDQIQHFSLQLKEKSHRLNVLEAQNAQLKKIIESKGSGAYNAEHLSTLKANEELKMTVGRLGRESEVFRTKIELSTKKIAELERENFSLNSKANQRPFFDRSYTDRLNNIIYNLTEKLNASVSLSDFNELLHRSEEQKAQLLVYQGESLYFFELQTAFKVLQNDFQTLNESLDAQRRENLGLLCEFQLLEARLSDLDESYFRFKTLMKKLVLGIRDKDLSPGEFLSRFLEESLSEQLTKDEIAAIFQHFGLRLFEPDFKTFAQFFCVEGEKFAISKDEFVRKVSLFNLGFKNFMSPTSEIIQASNMTAFDQLLDNCGLSSQELFQLCDFGRSGFVTSEQVCSGLLKLGARQEEICKLKPIIENIFFKFEAKISEAEFSKFLRNYSQFNWKKNILLDKEIPFEIEIGRLLNDFLEQNKSRFPRPSDFFHFLDIDCKGFVDQGDLGVFFREQVGLDFDGRKVEKFFSAIDKEAFEIGISEINFCEFLKKCKTLALTNSQISGIKSLNITLDKNHRAGEFSSSRSFELKIGLLRGELSSFDFKLKQAEILLSQVKAQKELLEKKDSDNARLLTIYKTEIAKLSEEAHNLRAAKNSPSETKRTHLVDFQREFSAIDHENLLKEAEQRIADLEQENKFLADRSTRIEEEALSVFFTATQQTSDKSAQVCNLLREAFFSAQEIFYKQKLSETNLRVTRLKAEVSDLEMQNIEDRTKAQIAIENLGERLAVQQQMLAQVSEKKSSIADPELIDKLAEKVRFLAQQNSELEIKNRELGGKIKDLEGKDLRREIEKEKIEEFEKAKNLGSDAQMIEKLRQAIVEAKNLKMANLQLEKELAFELADKNSLIASLKTANENIQKTECEVQRQIESLAEREIFWSEKYQKLLKSNLELKQLENLYSGNHRKIQTSDKKSEQNETGKQKADFSIFSKPKENKGDLRFSEEIEKLKEENKNLNSQISYLKHSNLAQTRQENLNPQEENSHKATLTSAAQKAVQVLQNLLDSKQLEITEHQKEIAQLRSKLADTEEKHDNLQAHWNFHFGDKNDQNEISGLEFLPKQGPKNSQQNNEQLIREVKYLQVQEKELRQQIHELKEINRELTERLKSGVNFQPVHKFQSSLIESQGLQPKNSEDLENSKAEILQLREKLRTAEETTSRREKEINSLMESFRTLKHELVEQSKASVTDKLGLELQKSEISKLRGEFEGKLKISAKRIKEMTLKLKELADELISLKDRDVKKEENLKKLSKDNVDLNLVLVKKHEEIATLHKKLEKALENCLCGQKISNLGKQSTVNGNVEGIREVLKERQIANVQSNIQSGIKSRRAEELPKGKIGIKEQRALLPMPNDLKAQTTEK